MSNNIKRYVILCEFFKGRDDFDELITAVHRNGVDFIGPCTDGIDSDFFMFSAKRVAMLGLVIDLVEAGVLGDDLLEDFDGAFEASQTFTLK